MHDRSRRKHQSPVRPGLCVDIIQKKDQRTGKLTRGRVRDVLTRSPSHPHGIKVRLHDGQVGRVAAVIDGEPCGPDDGPPRTPEDPADPGAQADRPGIRRGIPGIRIPRAQAKCFLQ